MPEKLESNLRKETNSFILPQLTRIHLLKNESEKSHLTAQFCYYLYTIRYIYRYKITLKTSVCIDITLDIS